MAQLEKGIGRFSVSGGNSVPGRGILNPDGVSDVAQKVVGLHHLVVEVAEELTRRGREIVVARTWSSPTVRTTCLSANLSPG